MNHVKTKAKKTNHGLESHLKLNDSCKMIHVKMNEPCVQIGKEMNRM